jgi:hypothetical protein
MPNILDKSFRYVPAAATDLKATFARIRREMKAKAEAEKRQDAKVSVIRKRGS